MDVFVHNLPPQTTENDLRRFLEPLLFANKVLAFHCSRLRKAGCAILTLLSRDDGLKVLRIFEDNICYQSRIVHCKPSHSEPNEWLLKSMQRDTKHRLKAQGRHGGGVTSKASSVEEFAVQSLACGLWDYRNDDLIFVSYFEDPTPGVIKFAKHNLELRLKDPGARMSIPEMRLDIPFDAIQSITTGNKQCPSLTISLTEAPRMYRLFEDDGARLASHGLEQMLTSLGLLDKIAGTHQKIELGRKKQGWKRLCHLGGNHHQVVATCLVYRVVLRNSSDLQHIATLEKSRGREIPPMVPWFTQSTKPTTSFHAEVAALKKKLDANTTFPFGLSFQLQKLNQNGCLPPAKVLAILPEVRKLVSRSGPETAIQVIRKLSTQLPFPGPATLAEDLDYEGLVRLIRTSEKLIQTSHATHVQPQNPHLCLIYKAVVTPAGAYLFGPDLEVGNRVLRQYSKSASQFL